MIEFKDAPSKVSIVDSVQVTQSEVSVTSKSATLEDEVYITDTGDTRKEVLHDSEEGKVILSKLRGVFGPVLIRGLGIHSLGLSVRSQVVSCHMPTELAGSEGITGDILSIKLYITDGSIAIKSTSLYVPGKFAVPDVPGEILAHSVYSSWRTYRFPSELVSKQDVYTISPSGKFGYRYDINTLKVTRSKKYTYTENSSRGRWDYINDKLAQKYDILKQTTEK